MVTLHVPLADTLVEPTATSSAYTVTTVPTVPVPLSVGVLSSVLAFWAMLPVTLPLSSLTPVIAGAAGRSPSRVKVEAGVMALTLPAASTASAVRLCGPVASGSAGVKRHVPSAATAVLPISLPLS
ncbi:MAG: hypothetical protein ABS94_27310 [Variovorax sp. SCN 67-85]|nr:hypothetical protein [Variovorax sp. SCN 67-85]ODU13216.1 MAG: hypothetical protein ABS94_27310 [Variovorax sp. SCN 67-85]